jgi:hypothetical protein
MGFKREQNIHETIYKLSGQYTFDPFSRENFVLTLYICICNIMLNGAGVSGNETKQSS